METVQKLEEKNQFNEEMLEGMLINAYWNFNPQEYKCWFSVSILIHIFMR